MSIVPELDPQGVKWMGTIPHRWLAVPTKWYFALQLGKMLQNNAVSDGDQPVPYLKAAHVSWGKVNTADLPDMWASREEISRYGVKAGDLLVCEGGDVGRAGIASDLPDNCIIQNALHRVRPKFSSDVRFFMYVLHAVGSSGWFNVLCNRATIAHFTGEKLADLRIPLPSLEEQLAITTFLDRETARIDALIDKKQRQIELLQEKRAAIISHAVTKGLDPNVEMKSSGFEWIGRIPKHWQTNRAKVLFREVNERTVTGEEELLTVSHKTGVTRRSEKDVNMFMAETLEGYKKCQAGDLIIT